MVTPTDLVYIGASTEYWGGFVCLSLPNLDYTVTESGAVGISIQYLETNVGVGPTTKPYTNRIYFDDIIYIQDNNRTTLSPQQFRKVSEPYSDTHGRQATHGLHNP